MSILEGLDSTLVTKFSGADQLTDQASILPPACIALQNCEFQASGVRTRRGFSAILSLAKSISAIYSWIQESFNFLIYMDTTTPSTPIIRRRDLVIGSDDAIISTGIASPVGMDFAVFGYRSIMAFFDLNGLSTAEGRIWDGTFTSGTPSVEKLFPGAPSTSLVVFTITEPGAGSITAGLHNFAVIITTRNGAQTPPGPWALTSAILVPQPFTSTGGKNINVRISSALWPISYISAQLVMTPVNNPNRWFEVPGASVAIAGGSSLDANITFDIDDLTLQSKGLDITETSTVPSLFSLYTQDINGNGPFKPHLVLAFNNRMVYFTRIPGPLSISPQGAMFVSEIGRPQFITLQFHLLQLPEFLDTITGCVLGASLYSFGPDWTYAFSDNTKFPVQWPPCRTISRTIGSPFIKGVLSNPARKITWVAAKQGLFAFNGQAYDLVPSSYSQGAMDWASINFAQANAGAANALEIIDYSDWQIVVVKAPIGPGQTVANFLLVWNYANGYDAASIRYCGKWWLNTPGGAQINIGAIALVHSQVNQYMELWLGAASAAVGKIYRQKNVPGDATDLKQSSLYDDDSAGVDAKYRTASLVDIDQPVYQQVGIGVRCPGNGQIPINAYSLDQTNPVALVPIQASTSSGVTNLRMLDKQSQAVHYEFTNGAVAGTWFYLSKIRAYFTKLFEQGNS